MPYARKNSRQLLCGFFLAKPKRAGGSKRLFHRRRTAEKAASAQHETVERKKGAPRSWHEEFVLEWSETFIRKKRNPK